MASGVLYRSLVDNQGENTLARAIRHSWEKLQEQGVEVAEVDIATGYFNLAGFRLIAEVLEKAPRVRLLLGVEPRPEAERPEVEPGETPEELLRKLLEEQLKLLEDGLKRQRDLLPFDRAEDEWVRRLLRLLYSGRVEVRQHRKRILHAKAYLFRCPKAGIWVGSSNFTWGGLAGNLELNLATEEPSLVEQINRWFDQLWEEAEPFDLAAIYDQLLEEFPPYLIFLRVLLELFGEQLEEERQEEVIPLTTFQKHGVVRALRIMERLGGVLLADGVGLGKTFIAGEIARRFIERRQRVLLVCPAALRDSTWKKFLSDFQLFAEVLSFEQLGEEQKLGGSRSYLNRSLEEYALVIVDEAHHYRNPNTPKRAKILERLLRQARHPKLLLLTATPVNNSLWDLYYLLRYFVRQDAALADRGILSIRSRFAQAMAEDPFNLDPDILFPILDATTVKRTRGFIKREYSNELIQLDGKPVPIRFARPVLKSIRYQLTPLLRRLLEELEWALAPAEGAPQLSLARYHPEQFLLPEYRTEQAMRENPVAGLLRSGLLKRFESSVYAFRCTVERLIKEHEFFLQCLDQGRVPKKELIKEISAAGDEVDDESLAALIGESDSADSLDRYRADELRRAVENDLKILRRWLELVQQVQPSDDPKLRELKEVLAAIAQQARREAISDADERRKRKVIVFSVFEDTIRWIESYLQEALTTDPRLAVYRDRMLVITGQEVSAESSRVEAIKRFAPSAAGKHEQVEDRYDLLLSTDVLAEGMNLEDCRNIVNFDLPWNPMRLVQRHGRVDRITTPHEKIYLRTFFPAEELEKLLDLDERIRRKLAQAAASVGVETPPIEHSPQADRSFAESRREMERILKEDPGLLEEGGRPSAALSSEEYRAKLRKGLEKYPDELKDLPWKAGSGMITDGQSGFVFLGRVGPPGSPHPYRFLRFVPLKEGEIVREIGTCLRLLQCEENTPRVMPDAMRLEAFDAWKRAREDIWKEWMDWTDPHNLQPRLPPLNHKIADFLRRCPPPNFSSEQQSELLGKVLSPWPRAVEVELRRIFEDPSLENRPQEKARRLAEKIEELGIEPFKPPEPRPPIAQEEIHLVCWMALVGRDFAIGNPSDNTTSN